MTEFSPARLRTREDGLLQRASSMRVRPSSSVNRQSRLAAIVDCFERMRNRDQRWARELDQAAAEWEAELAAKRAKQAAAMAELEARKANRGAGAE